MIDTQITTVLQESGLEPTQGEIMFKSFNGFFEQAKTFEQKAKAIVVTDVGQVKEMSEARTIRLSLKDIRVNAEKTRKELKEKSLREGKAIDGIANVIKALVAPIEEYLEKQEKFAEIKDQQEKEQKLNVRIDRVSEFSDPALYNLKEMNDTVFESLVSRLRMSHIAQIAAAKKTHEDMLAREKEDAEQRAKEKAENDELKRKQAEQDKILADERAAREKVEKELKDKQEAEQREKDAKIAQEKKEADEKIKLEKQAKYKNFLEENGVTQEAIAQGLFHTERVEKSIKLFKFINTFNIE